MCARFADANTRRPNAVASFVIHTDPPSSILGEAGLMRSALFQSAAISLSFKEGNVAF